MRGTDQLTLPVGTQAEERFTAFHRSHPAIYMMLCEKARLLKRRGHKRYSIDALLHVVRFSTEVSRDKSDQFKVNNNYSSHYARLIMDQEEDLSGFFETRALKAA